MVRHILSLILACMIAINFTETALGQDSNPPEPTSTIDRLAIPELPENPTPIDLGLNVYYYNCMPCHGDGGQGLTDEWRLVWEEDHQNCWDRGCHGNNQNNTFFLPTVVPPVIGIARTSHFDSEDDLFVYLKQTHPPQNPGKLPDEDYRTVSVYLFHKNGFDKLPVGNDGYAKLAGIFEGITPQALAFAASLGILVTAGMAMVLEKVKK
jgi:hypothetical protein